MLPDDECAAIERHLRELGRLGEDLDTLDRDIAQAVMNDPAVKRLLTITGVNLIVAAGLVTAIGDVRRFASSEKLVSYVGLNPRVRQSGLGRRPKRQDRCVRSSCASALGAVIKWRPSRSLASWQCFVGTCSARMSVISGHDQPSLRTRYGRWNCKRASRRGRATRGGRHTSTT